MSDRPPEGTRVGVVGTTDAAVADAVSAGGGAPVVDEAEALTGTDLAAVVAVGREALIDLVVAGAEAPVLPVSVDSAVGPVPVSALERATASVLAGEFDAVTHPLLAVEGEGTTGTPRALFDLALVTGEPARISEYTVSNEGAHVSTFRADGVVVATPTGSTGYARAATGPVVAPGTGVVAVVPISPFVTDADHWVLPVDGVELRVERDETPVDLVADGREVGVVEPGRDLSVSVGSELTVAVVEESAGFFD